MKTSCPTCGKTLFAGQARLRAGPIHCNQKCWRKDWHVKVVACWRKKCPRKTIKCKGCAKKLEVVQSKKEKYCSRKCQYRHKSGAGTRGGLLQVSCHICKKVYLMARYRLKAKLARYRLKAKRKKNSKCFCSRVCYERYWQKAVLSGIVARVTAATEAARVLVKCPTCCEKFPVSGWRYKSRSPQRFCSAACAYKSRLKPRIFRNCITCEKAFLYRADVSRFFCSKKCRDKRGFGVALTCPVCKKDFVIAKGTYNRNKHKPIRCSQKCYWACQLQKQQPNGGEITLGNILKPYRFTFTGNGKVQVGSKHPDFVHGKYIIELFGGFWHSKPEEKIRIQYFKNLGYTCLVIWYSELSNPQAVRNRVEQFLKKAA